MRTQFKDKGFWLSSMRRLYTGVFLFSLTFSVVFQNETFAAESCSSIFSGLRAAELKQGALLIHERDSKLHVTPSVEKVVKQHQRSTSVTLTKPADKLDAWFAQLNKVADKANRSTYAREQVKEILRNQHVMKPAEVPESYYKQQVRLAKERGHGDITLTPMQKVELAETVIKDQQRSLDLWVDYLVSKDTQVYPMWLKYWMFTGMTKLSKFDGETGTFGTRSKETVAPFVEVNYEALAYVADAVVRKVNKKSLADIEDPVFLKALDSVNFSKLYGQALYKLGVGRDGYFATNEGQWIRYEQGSDHMPLVKSLEGRNSGWCTAGVSTAQTQLSNGDFYVYYSKDYKGQNVVPRAAIRMDGDEIAEVRGVGKDQNLDSQISTTKIVSDKVNSFGERGAAFAQKDTDMKQLTAIEKKFRLGQALTKEDLVFLREIERPIQGFGHQKDPRIEEILSQRDVKEDYAMIFDGRYKKEEIALSAAEFINAGKTFKVLVGNLVILEPTQKMPELLMGDLKFMSVDSVEGMTFPRKVTGKIDMDSVTNARGAKLPTEVGGDVNMGFVTQAEGLVLPPIVKGHLDLARLSSLHGVTLPRVVTKKFSLGVKKPDGLIIPEQVKDLWLAKLESAQGIKFPKVIEESLTLSSLQTAEGLVLPKVIKGYLRLDSLKSAAGLRFPERVGGYLSLKSLIAPENVVLPKEIGGQISLDSLSYAKGLVFPEKAVMISLGGLTDARGLVLPKQVSEILDLSALQSPEGLNLPESVGTLGLNKLTSAKGLKYPQKVARYFGPKDF